MSQNFDLNLVQKLLQAGRHAEAEIRLNEICASPAADAESWFFLGVLAGMRGDAPGAEGKFRKALGLNADFVQAQFNLGIALRDQGLLEEARTEFEAVVVKQPQHADALNALGYVYLHFDRHDEAERCFRTALANNPVFPDALTNLGNVLALRKCWAEAIGYHRRALAVAPTHGGAAINLGNALIALGRIDEAVAAFRQAIAANPANAEAHVQLGAAFNHSGNRREAEQAFRDALQISPTHGKAQYFLAALGVGDRPHTAPPEYVSQLFDGYAESFDAELVGKLEYRIPEALLAAVQSALPDSRELDVLDLGCGTGLCGVLFKPLSRTLSGVDLSSKMVIKAREREIYDDLEVGDLIGFLHKREASIDVVLAADVFIYVGELDAVFRAASRALRAGGVFAFSVEAANVEGGNGCVLRTSGRYAHTLAYVNQISHRHGFVPVSVEGVPIRLEGNHYIEGDVHVWRRARFE